MKNTDSHNRLFVMLACACRECKKFEVPRDSKRGAPPLFESTMTLKEIQLDLGTDLLRLYLEKEGAQECNLIVLLKQLLDSLPEPLTDDEKKTLFQNITAVESIEPGMPYLDTWLSLGLGMP